MTTITQALMKLLYFDRFKPGFAEIEQNLVARFVLDRRLTKEQQLNLFLNLAYLGHRDDREVCGFADAARVYFGRSFVDLTDEEYTGIVGMLISPNGLQPTSTRPPMPNGFRGSRKCCPAAANRVGSSILGIGLVGGGGVGVIRCGPPANLFAAVNLQAARRLGGRFFQAGVGCSSPAFGMCREGDTSSMCGM